MMMMMMTLWNVGGHLCLHHHLIKMHIFPFIVERQLKLAGFKDGIDEFTTWTSWGIGSSEIRPGPPDQIATEFSWICKGTDDSISDQPRSHRIKWFWTIREFALLSRAEALVYGEQCLKFQVKKRNESAAGMTIFMLCWNLRLLFLLCVIWKFHKEIKFFSIWEICRPKHKIFSAASECRNGSWHLSWSSNFFH